MKVSSLLVSVNPFGFTALTLLALGGPDLIKHSQLLFENAAESRITEIAKAQVIEILEAQADLLTIDWKESAPVIFCNKFSIGFKRQSKKCR